MGKLTNLNPAAPIADADLPGSIARDVEYIVADATHIIEFHSIRQKVITGTTAVTQGGFVTFSLGMDSTKVQGVQVMVNWTGGGWIPNSYTNPNAGREFTWDIPHTNTTVISIINSANNSANILSKPVKIFISYIP
jgi:hypothetical protein